MIIIRVERKLITDIVTEEYKLKDTGDYEEDYHALKIYRSNGVVCIPYTSIARYTKIDVKEDAGE